MRLAILALALGLLAAPALPARAADAGHFYLLASARYAEFAEDELTLGADDEGEPVAFRAKSELPTATIGFGYQVSPKFALEMTLSYVDGDVMPPNRLGHDLTRGRRPDALSEALFGDSSLFIEHGDFRSLDDLFQNFVCIGGRVQSSDTPSTRTSVDLVQTCRAGVDIFDFQSVDLAARALWFPFSDSQSRLKPFLGFGVLHRWSEWTTRFRTINRSVERIITSTYETTMEGDPPVEVRVGGMSARPTSVVHDEQSYIPSVGEPEVVYEQKIDEQTWYGVASLGFEYRASRAFSWVPSFQYGFGLDQDDENFWNVDLAVKYAF